MKKLLLSIGLAVSLLPIACAKKPGNSSTTLSRSEVSEVSDYLGYIHSADTAEGLEHKYTSTSLRHLAKALDGVSRKSGLPKGEINDKLDSLMSMADSLQTNPQSDEHPVQVRAAFIRATELMESLQGAKFPDNRDEVSAVRGAAEAITPDQSALEQKPKIMAFFDKAGEALSAMAKKS
ncbi:MAG: hypothetical protein ABIW76_24420 [Fibrobacteria bacterium]